MFPFRRILTALSGTPTDAGLLDYAAMLGWAAAGAEFRFVHVAPSAEALRRAQSLEVAVHDHFRDIAGFNQVVCEFVEGERVDALLEIAATRSSDVILLGHRRGRSGRRSLARRLAMKAPCSMWLAPEGAPARLRRILMPIDFSRRAGESVELACALAESFEIDEAHALHVHFDRAALGFDEYAGTLAEDLDRAFCLFVAPIDLHGVHVKPLFVEGPNVAHTINRIAAELEADLVVMGTRGRSRSAAVLLGSETEQALIETRVPLLAVKRFGARLRLVEALLDRRLRDRGGQRFT
jgi:nucleotide-binding universal stress UspA family protein